MRSEPVDPTALPGHGSLIVAFSGGPDSVCLLHQLVRAGPDRKVVCIHVDHGLDPDSAKRARRASEIAVRLGAECSVIRVEVGTGRGPEASARRARYRALEARLAPGDTLLTGHHADDQAETVLLRLLRGAGPDGLSGIPGLRRFGSGWLARPLLGWTRSEIEGWIRRHELDCIRDPANECPDFDRNFLRREVLPSLRERWPGVDGTLRRSGRLCQGAAEFITDQVKRDLDEAAPTENALHLDRLTADSDYYRGAAIRTWCIHHRVEPPPGRRLTDFLEQLSTAAGDRCPQLCWDDAMLRYWKGRLWLDTGEQPRGDWSLEWTGVDPLSLPAGLGVIKLIGPSATALQLAVCSGRPGDTIRPGGDAHRRDCRRLLAEAGVPPWQRAQWPRLWFGGRLVALGTRWREAEFRRLLERRRQSLVWEPGPRRLVGHAAAGLESGS